MCENECFDVANGRGVVTRMMRCACAILCQVSTATRATVILVSVVIEWTTAEARCSDLVVRDLALLDAAKTMVSIHSTLGLSCTVDCMLAGRVNQ